MRTISQREMRNDSSEILRQVAAGESFVVTNAGVPVARLVPVADDEPGLPVARRATRRNGFTLPTRVSAESTQDILDELRADRSLDAIHVASASYIGAEAVVTYDTRMACAAAAAGIRVLAPA